jgi:quinol-cytochrome oxidoreductase complex cytochrome b subunit
MSGSCPESVGSSPDADIYMRNFLSLILEHLGDYPTPANFSYSWSFGSRAGCFLGIQLVTGIILAMHYVSDIDLAYLSVEHIMRDVSYGRILRYAHANGASMFFIVVYLHMARGLYYQSGLYPRAWVWCMGILIFLLMMATAFIGYVLPWGQMSYWGATVITNLASAIPFIGDDVVIWLWGGYSVNKATLVRFLSLHFILPFVLVRLAGTHIFALHVYGSTNPTRGELKGLDSSTSFYSSFYIKDYISWIAIFFIYFVLVFFYPNLLSHSDNYIEANPLVTPSHIVPEWYFLPFYAMLRAVPDKLGGVVVMLGAVIRLGLVPFLSGIWTGRFEFVRNWYYFLYWVIIFSFLILGFCGGQPAEEPFVLLGQVSTVLFFVSLLLYSTKL